jgi:hypothetical protein
MNRSLLIALAFLGCEPEPEAEQSGTCALTDAPEVILVRTLHIEVAADGISDGFDLDGVTSTEGGGSGCGIGDYTSPAGVAGIDNAFSRMVPAMEATEAKVSTIEGLVQSAIDSGELLIAFEVGGLDDWTTDTCVAMEVGQASGEAMLGTDGLLLDGQTFDRDDGAPTATLESAAIDAGVLVGRGLSIDLPVQILNAALTLPLRGGMVRIERNGDDLYEGVLAGAVSAAYLDEVANTENIDPTVADLVGTLVTINADLPDDDGTACAALSMTLNFEAVGAYYYAD